ncbi:MULTISPECIES: sigma-70 family RNA polymerase sigma factor [unclassified Nonomuraea]|uniref:sigma-70 family RNA polymerase sigma factor n=1 Tax=unclassified Nonomuraea TaxID=2593643 RepID=UPI00191BF17C|nr:MULTISPECIES: sigma-70 family RNA polymerase sigma factor [unclassified Nonomuraea]
MQSNNDLVADPGGLPEAERVFQAVRGRLFGIAYRMLGSVSEADDLLQEVWIRWQTSERRAVRNAEAFLATTTTRLAINVLRSARARHETYAGPWLPEPADPSADPALSAERAEALESAVLMLLERLTPTERASYVLREAFDHSYERIAEIIGHTPANVRQLVSRARKHLAAKRRASVTVSEQRRLLTAFVAAARSGEIAVLEAILAEDVVSCSGGGDAVRVPKARAVRSAPGGGRHHRGRSGCLIVGGRSTQSPTSGFCQQPKAPAASRRWRSRSVFGASAVIKMAGPVGGVSTACPSAGSSPNSPTPGGSLS